MAPIILWCIVRRLVYLSLFTFQSLILAICTEEMTGHVRPLLGGYVYLDVRLNGNRAINGRDCVIVVVRTLKSYTTRAALIISPAINNRCYERVHLFWYFSFFQMIIIDLYKKKPNIHIYIINTTVIHYKAGQGTTVKF